MAFDFHFVSSASFGKPRYVPPTARAWLGHAPFAFWLIENSRPNSLVELGTHHGYSYFCFCQQIMLQKLPSRCVAIDHWRGDSHAGFYDESVFAKVQEANGQYASFSRLMRASFADAVVGFPDCSIDLLHIDGCHRYEDVKKDFETWRPKLSDNAIVLFHDTQVRHGDFGVYRFWSEIAPHFPNLEFVHQYGLGVLGVGRNLPAPIKALLSLPPERIASVRASYERLGLALHDKPISRVEQCPCGSGKRYKHCHGSLAASNVEA
jgi:hypothetical protein